jgi:hypothetical protein
MQICIQALNDDLTRDVQTLVSRSPDLRLCVDHFEALAPRSAGEARIETHDLEHRRVVIGGREAAVSCRLSEIKVLYL